MIGPPKFWYGRLKIWQRGPEDPYPVKPGCNAEYNRLLRIEAQIEQSVLEPMNHHGGMHLPKNFVKNRHVFFVIDNVDFVEDTHDGKHTLHGTAMAIYQKTDPRDTTPQIRLVNKPFKIS